MRDEQGRIVDRPTPKTAVEAGKYLADLRTLLARAMSVAGTNPDKVRECLLEASTELAAVQQFLEIAAIPEELLGR